MCKTPAKPNAKYSDFSMYVVLFLPLKEGEIGLDVKGLKPELIFWTQISKTTVLPYATLAQYSWGNGQIRMTSVNRERSVYLFRWNPCHCSSVPASTSRKWRSASKKALTWTLTPTDTGNVVWTPTPVLCGVFRLQIGRISALSVKTWRQVYRLSPQKVITIPPSV